MLPRASVKVVETNNTGIDTVAITNLQLSTRDESCQVAIAMQSYTISPGASQLPLLNERQIAEDS